MTKEQAERFLHLEALRDAKPRDFYLHRRGITPVCSDDRRMIEREYPTVDLESLYLGRVTNPDFPGSCKIFAGHPDAPEATRKNLEAALHRARTGNTRFNAARLTSQIINLAEEIVNKPKIKGGKGGRYTVRCSS